MSFYFFVQHLVDMNETILLEDLARRRFPLTRFKDLLKRIKCQQALNVFEDASEL